MNSRPEYKLALDSRQSKPLPQQVEEEISRLIKMRAPGFQVNEIFQVQDIARVNQISRNTVTPAVRHLEQMGILDFNHKTGYRIVKTDPTILIPVREELPLSMGEWAHIHNCSLRDVYPFPAIRLEVGKIKNTEIRDTIKEWLLLDDQTPIDLIRRLRFLIRETDSTQSLPMYEEAYVRADALPELCDDFNRVKEEGKTSFSLFGYYLAHLKTKIRASHYFLMADGLPADVQPVWQRETTTLPISRDTVFTRLDSVNFAGPTDVSPIEKGGSLQYGREYYPSPYFRFKSANRQVDLTFG